MALESFKKLDSDLIWKAVFPMLKAISIQHYSGWGLPYPHLRLRPRLRHDQHQWQQQQQHPQQL